MTAYIYAVGYPANMVYDPTWGSEAVAHSSTHSSDYQLGPCCDQVNTCTQKCIWAERAQGINAEPERSTIADEAQSAVYGDRGKDYGHPRDNFTDTARLWTALLADRLTGDITPEDVARCMIAVKLARDLHSPKRDNRVDIIGYAITLDRLESGL